MKEKEITYTTEDLDDNGVLLEGLDGITLTEYKNLSNCYTKDCYRCNSITGVEMVKKGEVISVCSPISLRSIQIDKQFTYYEYEFINKTGKILTETFRNSEIGTPNMIKILCDDGMDIIDDNYFKKFIKLTNKVNQDVKNNTIFNGFPCDWLDVKIGSSVYGWAETEDNYDFNNFVTKKEIINKMQIIDGPLFKTSGTEEGQIEIIRKEIDDFKEPKILKIALSSAVCGVLLPIVKVDTPFLLITAPSGAGKQNISDLMCGFWGENHRKNEGLQRNSGDSPASRARYRTHLGVLPTVYDELQDAINKSPKSPSEFVKELAYEATTGSNGTRANTDSTLQDTVNNSISPMVGFCEGNQFSNLTDGGSSRIIIIDSGLADKKHYVKSEMTRQYMKDCLDNYGWLGMKFVKYIQKIQLDDRSVIPDLFEDYKKEADKYMEDKPASNAALLTLTYNLLVQAECLPKNCEKADLNEWFSYFAKFNRVVSSTEKIIDEWSKTVQNDFSIIELGKKVDYLDLAKNSVTKVRGRFEKISDTEMIVYMPSKIFRQQLENTADAEGLTGFVFDVERLYQAGIIEKSSGKDPKHLYEFRMRNITNTDSQWVMKIHINVASSIHCDDETQEELSRIEEAERLKVEKVMTKIQNDIEEERNNTK